MVFVKEAVEKATPCRPKALTSGAYGACPRCENLVKRFENGDENKNKEIKYCKWCGQALAWVDPLEQMEVRDG